MASYEQLSKDNWKVTVSLGYDDGKQVKTRKQGFKRKKDAERWVTDTLSQKHKGYVTSAESNLLLKDFITKWFNEYKIHTLSVNTASGYKSRINTHIIPKLGIYKINKITNMVVQEFYNSLINDGLAPSSVKTILDPLITCLKYAKKNKLIYELPTDIERITIGKTKIEYWHKDEFDFFLNEIKDKYLYRPVFIEILTGLRIGELCGLRWCDIDLDNRILYVRNQVVNDKINNTLVFTNMLKTQTSYRKITLPNTLINYLKSIKGNALDTDFVVLSYDGKMCSPRNLSINFGRTVIKYKLSLEDFNNLYPNKEIDSYMQLPQITFHGLRHTHATLLISEGENIKVVSERLGHGNITMTLDTYMHVMDHMKNNTADLLDNMFNNIIP